MQNLDTKEFCCIKEKIYEQTILEFFIFVL